MSAATGGRGALSEEAIAIAEGWSIMPPHVRAYINLLMGDFLGKEVKSPTLQKLFANANYQDRLYQEREERLAYAEAQGRRTATDIDDEEDED